MNNVLVNPPGLAGLPQTGAATGGAVAPAPVQRPLPIGGEDWNVPSLAIKTPIFGLDLASELSQAFGERATHAAPVWGGQAVDAMRGLQRALLGHSMKAQGEARNECLLAVQMVEQSLQWRLRLMQMREQLDPETGA